MIRVDVMNPAFNREYYGVKLVYDGDHVSLAYSIVDEKKHLMFLLKFNHGY